MEAQFVLKEKNREIIESMISSAKQQPDPTVRVGRFIDIMVNETDETRISVTYYYIESEKILYVLVEPSDSEETLVAATVNVEKHDIKEVKENVLCGIVEHIFWLYNTIDIPEEQSW